MDVLHYYNEFDAKTAAWLRSLILAGLIPNGVVDERSITEVQPPDLVGYVQHHFFAGIGGWSLALRLAGWPADRRVWTGSCPCQPFSVAGKQRGVTDSRHLWPVWYNLLVQYNAISNQEPVPVFGEQVSSKPTIGDGRESKGDSAWIDGVFDDLERASYSCWAVDIPSASVGKNHRRQRLFWFANTTGDGREGVQRCLEAQVQKDWASKALASWDSIGDPFTNWKEQLAMSKVCVLDDGIPSTMVVRPALKGFGNAIDPQLAAAFIMAACA